MTARRRMVLGLGAAGGAGALGLGVALWRERAAPSPHPVFTARFDRPEGGELVMASYLGRPLLLNFWATWCPPCIREMPLLGEFHRRQPAAGWQVVGLAADAGAPVREFIQRQPVPFAIGLAGFQGVELSRQLGNEGGGLPFSALFDADGRLLRTHVGELDARKLADFTS